MYPHRPSMKRTVRRLRSGSRWLLALACLCATASLCHDAVAQTPPQPVFGAPETHVGNEPRDVALGDLDGDTDTDAVVALTGEDRVLVLIGTGLGTFAAHSSVSVPDPIALTLAHLDGDAALDLAVGSRSGSLHVFLGDGSGGFGPGSVHPAGAWVQDVIAVDVAGSPALDIVAASSSDDGVSVLIGDGLGGFADAGLSLALGERFGIAAGDLDADGDQDLIASGRGQAVVLRNDAGVLNMGDVIPVAGASITAWKVVIARMDADADEDAVISTFSGQVWVADNRGDGTFFSARPFGVSRRTPLGLDVADLDGDGRRDIAVLSGDTPFQAFLDLLLSNAAGGYDLSSRVAGRAPWTLELGLIDADSRLDIAITTGFAHDQGKLTALLNRGLDDYGAYRVYEPGAQTHGIAAGALDDMRGLDLAVSTRTSTEHFIQILGNTGFGQFEPRGQIPLTAEPVALAAGDVDGDGFDDVVSQGDLGPLLLHRNDGTGGFDPPVELSGLRRAQRVYLAQIDGRPGLDVVVSANFSGFELGEIVVLPNAGDGTFPVEHSYPTGGVGSRSSALGDLDRDGDLDAVTGDRFAPGISVLLNGGAGAFGPASFIGLPSGSEPIAVAAGDIDGDGDADIAVADVGQELIHVYETQPGPTLVPLTSLAGTSSTTDVALRDLNGDGFADLVVATPFGASGSVRSVQVALSTGAGSFDGFVGYGAGVTPFRLAIADFSGDRRLDLAVTDDDAGEVWVHTTPAGAFVVDFDLDYMGDAMEIDLGGFDPEDPDSDDDGIFDGIDPDLMIRTLEPIPLTSFRSAGAKRSLMAQLDGLESQIQYGELGLALQMLDQTVVFYDGCISQKDPDPNDWITDCNAQFRVLLSYETLRFNLGRAAAL